MTTPEELARIDFGRLDAESDPRLLDYFLVTGTVKKAEQGAKLVIGRKGSGKTALFTHLKHNLPTVTIDLDLLDYVFEMHKGLTEAGLTAERAYVASWKLLIYAAVFGGLRSEMEASLRTRGDKALEALGLGENAGMFRPIASWLKRVRRVDLPTVMGSGGGGVKLGDKQSNILTGDTIRWLDELEAVLKAEVELSPVTVLIDRLDDAWDGDQESLDLIGGAIRATRDIAIAWGQPSPAPVITFLRTDLWEKLSFNDKNKMSQDIIYLDWTPEQLAEVVDLRVHNSLATPLGSGWERAFTTDEMRQRAGARDLHHQADHGPSPRHRRFRDLREGSRGRQRARPYRGGGHLRGREGVQQAHPGRAPGRGRAARSGLHRRHEQHQDDRQAELRPGRMARRVQAERPEQDRSRTGPGPAV